MIITFDVRVMLSCILDSVFQNYLDYYRAHSSHTPVKMYSGMCTYRKFVQESNFFLSSFKSAVDASRVNTDDRKLFYNNHVMKELSQHVTKK